MDEQEKDGAATQTTVQTTVQTVQTREAEAVQGPRIYVASLADYNVGRLHGWWISAFQPVEDIRRDIDAMLAQSEEPIAKKWAIHDCDGFDGLGLRAHEDLGHVAAAAQLLNEYGEVVAGLLTYLGGVEHVDDARQYMEEGYRGAFDSLTHYVSECMEDRYGDVLNSLPRCLRDRLDYTSIALDMERSGDMFTVECGCDVHVFDAHI